jgi:transposase
VRLEDVDIWFQDESRIGQQGSRTRIWAKKGTRPRVVKQQQFLYEYIYGAVCPAQKQCAAVIFPFANHEGLNEHLKEISAHVPSGRHAVVVQDQAGWHHKKELQIPSNISILHLPPYSPELNPQEQVWQHLKDNYLANRVFENNEDIALACCRAWNAFAQMPDFIHSLTTREWPTVA